MHCNDLTGTWESKIVAVVKQGRTLYNDDNNDNDDEDDDHDDEGEQDWLAKQGWALYKIISFVFIRGSCCW